LTIALKPFHPKVCLIAHLNYTKMRPRRWAEAAKAVGLPPTAEARGLPPLKGEQSWDMTVLLPSLEADVGHDADRDEDDGGDGGGVALQPLALELIAGQRGEHGESDERDHGQ